MADSTLVTNDHVLIAKLAADIEMGGIIDLDWMLQQLLDARSELLVFRKGSGGARESNTPKASSNRHHIPYQRKSSCFMALVAVVLAGRQNPGNSNLEKLSAQHPMFILVFGQ